MAMSPPTPHSCSTTRITYGGGEKYAAPAAVLTNEPCLIAPFQPGANMQGVFMGPIDNSRFVLFIDYDCDVQLGDVVTNDDTAETFVVTAPPVKFQRPTDFSNDHQQIEMQKQGISE